MVSVLLINVYSVTYKQKHMFIHKKDISIHLDSSIKLFNFDLLYPKENKNDSFFSFIYGLSIYKCTF